MPSNCPTLCTMHLYHFSAVSQGYLVNDRSCLRFPPTLQNHPMLAKKGNSSHNRLTYRISWLFRGFPQLLQEWQDARVLGWHIDYPDFFVDFLISSRLIPGCEGSRLTHRLTWLFRGFPQLLQACQDARILGWHIDYPDVFSWFTSAPPDECQDVRVLGW